MASYLPERTDNDIKNYWNTHLKKKLRRIDTEGHGGNHATGPVPRASGKGDYRRDRHGEASSAGGFADGGPVGLPHREKPFLSGRRPVPTSTLRFERGENISRLLENWKRRTPDRRKPLPGPSRRRRAPDGGSVNSELGRLSPETGLFQEDSVAWRRSCPLSLFETWLLDESYTGAVMFARLLMSVWMARILLLI
ncbi:hypothetical protein HPP92_016858 [Vanilla planifolia]|uniref:HTH myb-type domain-containing protein n=1 Tax=Vanilla planifolia TaxID=51239 RepID=A0A835QEV7_VANPL|nr:hypothetical protein HPP92_016858 [Vanilla planifolia]